MKIASSTVCFRAIDLEDALRRIAGLGIKYVELSSDHHCHLHTKFEDGVAPEEVRRVVDACGLEVAAVAATSDFAVNDAHIDAMLDWVSREIRFCRALGASILRIYAGHMESQYLDDHVFERVIGNIKRIVPLAEENGVQLAVENHFGITATADDMLRLIEGVASPWLGANYDPANFVPEGVDPVAEGRRLGPYIKHTHLKDPIYVGAHEYFGYAWVEIGKGMVDYPGVMGVLREIDYQGFLSLEYESSFDPVRGTRASLEYLQQLLAA